MIITNETMEILKRQGIIASMFPSDEMKQKEYDEMLAKYENGYRYINSTTKFVEGRWITEGEERPNYKEYAKQRVDNQFANNTPYRGMWYDATVLYIRKGDMLFKRTVNKSQAITEEFVLGVVAREEKVYSGAYGQFAKDINKLFREKFNNVSGWVYPTTYGIGVWVFFNFNAKECIEQVKSVLDSMNIEYTNEFSDARFVYRFKISKKEINRKKLAA